MSKFVFDFGSFWAPFWSLLGCLLGAKLGPKSVKKSTSNCKIALGRFLGDLEAIFGLSWAVLGRSWGRFGRSWGGLGRSWGALGRSWGGLGRSWSLLGALFYCVGYVGVRGSRPSEPREARRAKAEALMIMYFHVVNCLWLLGWFGDVLSCLGCILLCIFVLESFSRCGRPRACFVELIRCSRPWACFGELKRRFPFSAAQVSGGPPVLKITKIDNFRTKKLMKIQHDF